MKLPRPAERVHLTEDVAKIVSAITYVIATANARGRTPTQYDIVKAIFLADRSHLNRWGRPITFDNYVAMKHGPVPSLAYDLAKGNQARMRKAQIETLPWSCTRSENGKLLFSTAKEIDVDETFSPSEIEALEAGIVTVLQLGFSKVRKLTHEDAAYVEAWDDESEAMAFDMSLGLMFDEPDFETARTLAEYSPYRS